MREHVIREVRIAMVGTDMPQFNMINEVKDKD